jgi:hypothetical protein
MVDRQEVAMRPIRLDTLSAEQLRELDELYHQTYEIRVRPQAQMILLAAEDHAPRRGVGAVLLSGLSCSVSEPQRAG